MKKTNLIIMCGCPASGKSTYVKEYFDNENYKIVSRDKIRFGLLEQFGETEYFAFEKDVFTSFVREINKGLANGKDTVADATHLSERSRNKLLDRIKDIENYRIIMVCVEVPLNTCLERNEKREGYAKVPYDTLRRMYFSYERPSHYEKYKYDEILVVSE